MCLSVTLSVTFFCACLSSHWWRSLSCTLTDAAAGHMSCHHWHWKTCVTTGTVVCHHWHWETCVSPLALLCVITGTVVCHHWLCCVSPLELLCVTTGTVVCHHWHWKTCVSPLALENLCHHWHWETCVYSSCCPLCIFSLLSRALVCLRQETLNASCMMCA